MSIIKKILGNIEQNLQDKSLRNLATRLDEDFSLTFNEAAKLWKRSKEYGITDKGFEKYKIAVLTNHTPDFFLPFLYSAGFAAGLDFEIFSSGYDGIIQQVTNPESKLYRSEPKTIILYYLLEERVGESYFKTIDRNERKEHSENFLNEVEMIINAIRSNLKSAQIVVHNFSWIYPPALGYLDHIKSDGPSSMLDYLDTGLREICKNMDSCYILDSRNLMAKIGLQNWRDPNRWFSERIDTVKGAPHLAREYMRFIKSFSKRNRKVIVLDLDNTIWGGLAGEEGIEGVQIGGDYPGIAFKQFQYLLKQLRMKGVLLAVNSKNNPEDIYPIFRDHPEMVLREDDFVMIISNWSNKAQNMREISRTLNLNLDSFIFIDDNPAERQLIREILPEVLVPEMPLSPAGYSGMLTDLTDLDYPVYSDTDKSRTEMYQSESKRVKFHEQVIDIDSYLRLLETEVRIGEAKESDISRLEQMFQRTNQFNMTTKRYVSAELKSFMKDNNVYFLIARMKDKFGDSGLVGTALIFLQEKATIDSFLISCRVIGRNLETVMLSYIAEVVRKANYSELFAEFISTSKNKPAEKVFQDHDFEITLNSGDLTIFKLTLDKHLPELTAPESIKIVEERAD